MMTYVKTLAAAAGLSLCALAAQAATFNGYAETSDVYFNDAALLDYDPLFGGVIFEDFGAVGVLIGGFETLDTTPFGTIAAIDGILFEPVFNGTLIDVMLTLTGGDDELSFLFQRDIYGVTEYAIGTFIGELGNDPFTDGVFQSSGLFRLVGAEATVVPLPATLPLMLAGLGGFVALRRRKTRAN